MRVSCSLAVRACALLLTIFIGGFIGTASAQPPGAQQPGYVLFLDDYPRGRFHLAELPDLAARNVKTVRPKKLSLDLPRRGRRKFQVANGDVFYDSTNDVRRIVFGGRTGPSEYWGIYEAEIDVSAGSIEGITPIVSTDGVREEDPRFSTDGTQIVYKRDGQIYLVTPQGQAELFHAEEGCELWAPAMYFNDAIAYARRCGGDEESDRIVYHRVGVREGVEVPNQGGGPDRFAHFTRTGELVYSHVDTGTDTASLWLYDPISGTSMPLHDETSSDDDAYAERNGDEYIAFSGWGDGGYDLYIYRRTRDDAVQLTDRVNVLGSVLFD